MYKKKKTLRKIKKSRNQSQNGGLKLKNQNMDCSSPFHPIWNPKYINGPFVGREGVNTYTFLQDGVNLNLAGGKKNKRSSKKIKRSRKSSNRRNKRSLTKSNRR